MIGLGRGRSLMSRMRALLLLTALLPQVAVADSRGSAVAYRNGVEQALPDNEKTAAVISECIDIVEHAVNAWHMAHAGSQAAGAKRREWVLECHFSVPVKLSMELLQIALDVEAITIPLQTPGDCMTFFVKVADKYYEMPIIGSRGCGRLPALVEEATPPRPRKKVGSRKTNR